MVEHRRNNPEQFGTREYYILALLAKTKLRSLYDFQQEAFIEPGSIRLALDRLEVNGFIKRAESSFRNRREFSTTNAGYQFLEENWENLFKKSYWKTYCQTEAILRTVTVALLMGHPLRAAEFLANQIWRIEAQADVDQQRLEATEQLTHKPEPLTSYRWMRDALLNERRKGEARVLHETYEFIRTQYKKRIDEEQNELKSQIGDRNWNSTSKTPEDEVF